MAGRMAALAIGVSDATPLPYLAGAVNGARAFHEWAQAFGYESRLVTDETDPVTAARVRQELEALLQGGETHRLLIYFAGHGVIREAEEGLWLLSDWNDELRAVAVEVLRRRLYAFQVEQIAFFADACRSLPADIVTADLTADGLLGKGPGQRSGTVAIDKFIAAQDGTRTFTIPGRDPDDDRCLFSGVLLEGLWGTKPGAFSKLLPGKVTSRSLGAYLEREVPPIAERYEVTLQPSVSPTFPEDDDVYFGDGPAVTPPVFPPWPTADEMKRFLPGNIGVRRGIDEAGLQPVVEPLEDRIRAQERPATFETGSGFAVDGDDVVAVWTAPGVIAEAGDRANWWRIRPRNKMRLTRPACVLIELASGRFAAVTAVPEFIATVLVNEQGVTALVQREVHAPSEVGHATEDALGRLERGGLRADDATDIAVALRQDKHVDPVRGVLAAYLYDSIGDGDSIRQMAFYYVKHRQAIPYDIALLANLHGSLRRDGLLSATVPAVAAREPRTEQERRVDWAYAATGEASGVVGGLWPWLRQGWAFLDDPAADGSTLVLPGLDELAHELLPARFATFNQAGGRRLASLFNLKPKRREGTGPR